ncbi:FCP1-like proteiny domain-containing protein [Mycena kentingensis (nom. inval.)]|nr:FCP1-like proteiny domain-containing protein [Mycena kentingensis (nom. inval.)]
MANKKTSAQAPAPAPPGNSAPPVPHKAAKSGNPSFVKYYLLAYNVLSALGWGYILILTLVHLSNLDGRSDNVPKPMAAVAPSAFSRFMSSIPFFKSAPPPAAISIQSRLPSFLKPVYSRSMSTYTRVGNTVLVVQTFAVLEVAHVLLKWVRSPFQTTAMQVASRLWIVWGIVQQFGVARANPLYTSCVLAWSITEVVRYSFYASNLLGVEPAPLLYLRYTLFYILYPIGAGSEAFLSYATLPLPSGIPSPKSFLGWSAPEYLRFALFLTWWPSLYQLYTHMIKQRRKIFGGGASKPKTKTN